MSTGKSERFRLQEKKRIWDQKFIHESDQYKVVCEMLDLVFQQLDRIEKKIDESNQTRISN